MVGGLATRRDFRDFLGCWLYFVVLDMGAGYVGVSVNEKSLVCPLFSVDVII